MHVPAQLAGKKFSAGWGCPRSCARTNPWVRGKSVRKNRPLVPRSNIAGSWAGEVGRSHSGKCWVYTPWTQEPHHRTGMGQARGQQRRPRRVEPTVGGGRSLQCLFYRVVIYGVVIRQCIKC